MNNQLNTIASHLQNALDRLRKARIDTAQLDAEVLLAHALGIGRADLYCHRDRELTGDEKNRLDSFISRRTKKEPFAYIVGFKEFWSLKIKVTPDVLIPRPETEGIIEQSLIAFKKTPHPHPLPSGERAKGEGLIFLDLCTGSGCVAAVLASEFPKAQIIATDICPAAIEVAKSNIAFAVDRVDLYCGDLFDAVPLLCKPALSEVEGEGVGEVSLFDLITANPPYIADGDYPALDEDIRNYEPRHALLAGTDGLAISKQIIKDAPTYLKPGGTLIMEMGIGQSCPLREFAKDTGQYEAIKLVKDYSGIERILVAKRLSF